MATDVNSLVKPFASRYKLSTAYKFVGINFEGQRTVFGGCTSLAFNHNRPVNPHSELNYDPVIIELTPGIPDAISIQVNGLALSTSTLMSQFSGVSDIQGLYDQSIYFDIEKYQKIQRILPDGSVDPRISSTTTKLLCTYKDCLFQSWSETAQITGDIVVTETATILARTVEK